MSLINSEIKPFKATAYHNGKFATVTNEDLKGKWSVIAFYPADFTFVCPTELGDLADNYASFKKLGVEIYGVSTDTHFTHKAWHDTSETIGKVQYPLIGDPTLALSRHLRHQSRRPHQDHRSARQRNRPRREGIAAQGTGGAIRGLAPGRGVPREMDPRRQDPVPVARSGRQDLIAQANATVGAACSKTISKLN
jgi:peroxiredoxin